MHLILVFLGFIISTQNVLAAAEPPVFCAAADLNMNGANDCYSTCSAIADNPAAHLAIGQDGMCHGSASYQKFYIYSLSLGQESAGTNESVCTIFDGIVEITSSSQSASFAGGNSIDLTACPAGTYDLLFLTASRYDSFKAETEYPDGSGKIIRTTSTFANPNTETDFNDSSQYTEVGRSYSDNTKGYMRPADGYSTIYMKLGNSPVSADLSGSSSATMIFDWMKMLVSGGTVTNIRDGWYCEDITYCDRINSSNADRMDSVMNADIDILDGLPLTIGDNAVTVPVRIDYFQTNRGDNEELGARFVWHNDGGIIKALGVNPGDSGIYITIGEVISESN